MTKGPSELRLSPGSCEGSAEEERGSLTASKCVYGLRLPAVGYRGRAQDGSAKECDHRHYLEMQDTADRRTEKARRADTAFKLPGRFWHFVSFLFLCVRGAMVNVWRKPHFSPVCEPKQDAVFYNLVHAPAILQPLLKAQAEPPH